jgi:beta-barrel assembly-enhancing protease
MMKGAVILLSVLLLPAVCASFDLRDIGKHMDTIKSTADATQKAARPISDEEEYFVGRAVAAQIISSFQLSDDRALTAYISKVGQTVALHSEKPYTYGGYHFALLDSDDVNAFACPGGTIFITRGMLKTAGNEDELAAVLAHEIAHVNHQDGIAAIKKSRWTEAATIIGSSAVKEYGAQDLSKLVSIFEGSIDDIVKTLVVNGYGRDQEFSADKAALTYLEKTAYNPAALNDFLDRLAAQGKASKGGMLKTHPGTLERVEKVKASLPERAADSKLVQKRATRFSRQVL